MAAPIHQLHQLDNRNEVMTRSGSAGASCSGTYGNSAALGPPAGHSHSTAKVGNVNRRKTSLISLGDSRIFLSSHQLSTRTNVEATYAATKSGGIWPTDFRPDLERVSMTSAMISVSTLRRCSCKIALPRAPILSPQACACL